MNKLLILTILVFVAIITFTFYWAIPTYAFSWLHQQNDYEKAIEVATRGEWYEYMRITCEPNEEFKDDKCMRGLVVGHLTQALRGIYYLDNTSIDWIGSQYADTKLEDMFNTRVVEKEKILYVDHELSDEEINQLVKEKLLLLLN